MINQRSNSPGVFSTSLYSIFFFLLLSACGPQEKTEQQQTFNDFESLQLKHSPNLLPQGQITSPLADVSINAGESVTFSGAGTDADNNLPLKFLWSFDGAQPNISIQNPGAVRFDKPGVYRVSLTVSDSEGAVDNFPATRLVTVSPVNGVTVQGAQPNGVISQPVGDQTINVGQSIRFRASGSDPDGNALTYYWDFAGAAPNSNLQNPPDIIFQRAGVYPVRMTVTDSTGLSDPTPAQLSVTVLSSRNVNEAPESWIVSPATDVTINQGDVLNFSGVGLDPNGDTPLSFLWDFNGGAVNSNVDNPGNVTFNKAGIFRVSLNVSDSRGLSDPTPAQRTITVLTQSSGNQAPVGRIVSPSGDRVIAPGDSLYFSGTGSDADNDLPLQYFWNFDNATATSAVQTPGNITFNQTGSYRVRLNVRDARGAVSQNDASILVTVRSDAPTSSNQPPNGFIVQPMSDQTIRVGSTLYFSANASDPDGVDANIRYNWNFGNNMSGSDQRVPGNVTFSQVGLYEVRLTVTDEQGLSDPSPAVLRVNVQSNTSNSVAPEGRIISPSSAKTIAVGQSLYFTATASSSSGNGPFFYNWDFNGGATNSTQQKPGNVFFNRAGTYRVRMTVKDQNGLADPSPDERIITVTGSSANQLPAAYISSPSQNQSIVVGERVFFSGAGTDADGDYPLSYAWSFGSAAPSSSAQTPGNIRFTVAGTYVVSLYVTDSRGGRSSLAAMRTITVLPLVNANQLPNGIIDSPLGNTSIQVGQSVNFLSSGSDPDANYPLSYHWDFGGGAVNSSLQDPGAVVFTQAGDYLVTLTVKDSLNAADATPDSRLISVRNPPTASAPDGRIISPGNSSINSGERLYFTATVNDSADNGPYQFQWDFDGGAANSSVQKPGYVSFNTPGIYNVSLTVSNASGVQDATPASVRIEVQGATQNSPPNGSIDKPLNNPVVIRVGNYVDFSGSATDLNGDVVSYLWDFDNVIPVSSQPVPGRVYFNSVGTYTISLTVTDSHGLADPTPDTRTIEVRPVIDSINVPQSVISSPVGSQSIQMGEKLFFSGSGSDALGRVPLSYRWDFDGAVPNSNAQNPGDVVFNSPGQYRVTLTVINAVGIPDDTPAEIFVNVSGQTSNKAPDGQISSPLQAQSINVGDSIYFSATGSDPDGDTPLSYRWDFDGAAPVTMAKTPGNVRFDQVGSYKVRLTVIDSQGMRDATPATVTIQVNNNNSRNQAPNGFITSPSTDVVLYRGGSIDFRAIGSDVDGNIPLTYRWHFDGAAQNYNGQNPGVLQLNTAGEFMVSLQVSDALGLGDPTPAIRRITVLDVPVDNGAPNTSIDRPTASQQINVGEVIYFDGSAIDPDGDALTYYWNFDGAVPNAVVATPGNVRFDRAGSYRISLNAWDSKGLSDPTPAVLWVVVSDPANTGGGLPPDGVIDAPAQDVTINLGAAVYFSASALDPDGSNALLRYRWDFDGIVANSNAKTPGNVVFNKVGSFRIRMTVTDSSGLSDPTPAELMVTVRSTQSSNQAPETFIIEPAQQSLSIVAGDSVFFHGSGTDADNNFPLRFLWDFSGGAANVFGASPGNIVFNYPGTYQVWLKASDALGMMDATPALRTIVVRDRLDSTNIPPDAQITPGSDQIIAAGESINFSASVSDPDSSSFSYFWSFGGAVLNSNLKNPGVVVFKNAGIYTVSLQVTDDKGAVDPSPAKITVTVVDGGVGVNHAPQGQISAPSSDRSINVGDSVYFAATASDQDGDGISYRWDLAGIAPNSSVQTPGNIRFNKIGTFTILLTVTDTQGLSDPTPDAVIITVR